MANNPVPETMAELEEVLLVKYHLVKRGAWWIGLFAAILLVGGGLTTAYNKAADVADTAVIEYGKKKGLDSAIARVQDLSLIHI